MHDTSVRLDDVHRAPVGDLACREVGHALQRLPVIEALGERVADGKDEAALVLDQLAVVDVGRRPDPEVDAALHVADGHRPPQMPPVASVGCAKAVLDLEGVSAPQRLAAPCDGHRQVVGMHDRMPGVGTGLGRPRVLEPAPVEVRRFAVDVRGPDDLRHRVGELAVALFASLPECRELLRVQLLRLLLELHVLLPQLDEDRHLRAQDARVDWLEDVVDGARRIAAIEVLLLLREGRDEDDGNVLRPLAALDQLRELVPVEIRHLDVEQDAGEILEQQLLERRGPRRDGDEAVPERLEYRLEREEILLVVVDEQDVRAGGAHESPSTQSP